MNNVYAAAFETEKLFDQHNWRSCVIGGLAVIRWGRPRSTQDADFSLFTGFGDEDAYILILESELTAREPGEAEFARSFRVYRGFASNGTAVDIGLAGFPFEADMIDRASEFDFRPDCRVRTCSAEDLIVMKSLAGRNQDWADVRNVAGCQWSKLDWDLIDESLEMLCEITENLTAVPNLTAIRTALSASLD